MKMEISFQSQFCMLVPAPLLKLKLSKEMVMMQFKLDMVNGKKSTQLNRFKVILILLEFLLKKFWLNSIKCQVLNIKQGKHFMSGYFRKVTMSVFLVRLRGRDSRALSSDTIFPGRRKHMVRGTQKEHRDLSGRHQIRPAYFLG